MTPGLFLIAGLLFILALLAGLALLVWILVAGGSLALGWAALNPPPPPRPQPPLIDRLPAPVWPHGDAWPAGELDAAVDVPVVCVTRITSHRRRGRR